MKNIYIYPCHFLVLTALFLSCFSKLYAQNHLGHPSLITQTATIPRSEPYVVPFLSDKSAAITQRQNAALEPITIFRELTTLEAFIIPLSLPEGVVESSDLEGDFIISKDSPLPSWMEYYSYDHSLKGMPPVGSDGSFTVEFTFSSPKGPLSYKLFLFVTQGSKIKPQAIDGLSYMRP